MGRTPHGICTFALVLIPPGRNGVAGSVCILVVSLRSSNLTNYLLRRGPSSHLNAGPSQQSYGAFRPNTSTPYHDPSHSPATYTPSFAAPGPASSRSPQDPLQSAATERLVSCLIILILCILVACRSDTLENYLNIQSEASRASAEASALVAEREKWGRERDDMRHDREVWEKVPEGRVPSRAYWVSVGSSVCRAYGKQEYEGVLRNIPEGWGAIDACMNTPVSIRTVWDGPAVKIRQPYRCALVDGFVQGYWILDQYQDDCKPKLKDVHDIVSPRPPSTLYSRSRSLGMHKL